MTSCSSQDSALERGKRFERKRGRKGVGRERRGSTGLGKLEEPPFGSNDVKKGKLMFYLPLQGGYGKRVRRRKRMTRRGRLGKRRQWKARGREVEGEEKEIKEKGI